ncbi:MAG: asparagine synthase (glutamine-hydrolyzing) [Candidatus Fermentibacteraceae bacterium]
MIQLVFEGKTMCGVTGIVSRDMSRETMTFLLSRMNGVQRHRGPDESAVLVHDHVGIGFDRLAILDLSTGMQPITAPEDRVTIACNGQVYNYLELRRMLPGQSFATSGDMEVALHLYRKFGTAFLTHLNGMYAGVIHDPVRRKLVLFRDRFGIKPMHYTTTTHGFFFSSEIPPLLQAPGVTGEIDTGLLPVFFNYRYLPGERTIYRRILRLPPGSFLEFDLDNGTFQITRYWNYDFTKTEHYHDADEAAEEFLRLFRDSVRIRLRSDVEVGSFISGGIDSSAVASLTAGIKPDLKLFTVAFSEEAYDETHQVDHFVRSSGDLFASTRRFVRKCSKDSLRSLPEIVRALGEPLSLGAVIPTDQVCELASEHVKVALTGEGADEIFAGYRKFLVEDAFIKYRTAGSPERRRLMELYPELGRRLAAGDIDPVGRHIASESLFSPGELHRLLGANTGMDVPLPLEDLPDLRQIHPVKAMQALECRTRLPDYVIARLDRLSMRHSLEARTPFLDYRLAEFAACLPVDLKLKPFESLDKYICRKAFADSGILPDGIAMRPKKPFTMPMAQWFESVSDLPDPLREIAEGGEVDRQGILDGQMVRELAKAVTGQGVGPETLVSGADRFFAPLIFTLWYKECVEKR